MSDHPVFEASPPTGTSLAEMMHRVDAAGTWFQGERHRRVTLAFDDEPTAREWFRYLRERAGPVSVTVFGFAGPQHVREEIVGEHLDDALASVLAVRERWGPQLHADSEFEFSAAFAQGTPLGTLATIRGPGRTNLPPRPLAVSAPLGRAADRKAVLERVLVAGPAFTDAWCTSYLEGGDGVTYGLTNGTAFLRFHMLGRPRDGDYHGYGERLSDALGMPLAMTSWH